jgi:hypothetical protein
LSSRVFTPQNHGVCDESQRREKWAEEAHACWLSQVESHREIVAHPFLHVMSSRCGVCVSSGDLHVVCLFGRLLLDLFLFLFL